MIPREAQATLDRLARGFPVVAITGPRQSGKTTLARATRPGLPYVSLESPDERSFAQQDPRGFLGRFPQGAILDEVQRVPELLSWLQTTVDDAKSMGMYILTGSQQPELTAQLTQSLAGRVGRIELLALSRRELAAAGELGVDLNEALYRGGYPAPFDRDVDPTTWLSNYVATYVERDVRQLIRVRDLDAFARFVRLCAGRTGQLVNASNLADDTGISVPTAQEWLSVLQATYIVTLIRPHHANTTTRLVKTPKLHFLDSGLASYLIGIDAANMLATHPLRGPVFESWVVSELLKADLNLGRRPDIRFLRDKHGNEIDLIVRISAGLQPIEIKAGATYSSSWAAPFRRWSSRLESELLPPLVIYGGEESYTRDGVAVTSWRDLAY